MGGGKKTKLNLELKSVSLQLKQVLTPSVYQVFETKLFDLALQQNPNFQHCPFVSFLVIHGHSFLPSVISDSMLDCLSLVLSTQENNAHQNSPMPG